MSCCGGCGGQDTAPKKEQEQTAAEGQEQKQEKDEQ